MKPGEYLLNEHAGGIEANAGRAVTQVLVRHTGDRPIQVGSHYHFFEVNSTLQFDRQAAFGMRLNIAAGTAVRFEPGVEKDFTVYGDEVTFGGGKVIRDGMGQSSRATREETNGALDLVITNPLIIDYWGIVKGDIGIKDGRIVKVGKAGNPDTMEGVDPELVIGASTEVIAGENMLVTAGGIDGHIHFIAPQQIYEAISNGITTMIGGGTGPATGTNATTCTPGAWNIARMLQAAESWPMNF